MQVKEMLTVRQVAERYGVAHWTVRHWIKQGKLSTRRFGWTILIPAREIARLDRERGPDAAA